jgi:threonyl-tRNA synthetase
VLPVPTGGEMKTKDAHKNIWYHLSKAKMLDEYLVFLEEAKRRDHRELERT